ncbi:MAG: DUF2892 domain-containing protein [Paucibacter sp.]|nr:DUF2892 domain-containing protein [Roseateles sp.]
MIQNVGDVDRLVRIAAGVGLIVPAMIGLIGPIGWVGTIVLATGLLRVCPAYLAFGVRTNKAKSGSASRDEGARK